VYNRDREGSQRRGSVPKYRRAGERKRELKQLKKIKIKRG
jgi:hypothetical protein